MMIFPSFDKALGGAQGGGKTTGELVEEIPPHHEIAEGAQTEDKTGLVQFPGSPY